MPAGAAPGSARGVGAASLSSEPFQPPLGYLMRGSDRGSMFACGLFKRYMIHGTCTWYKRVDTLAVCVYASS